MATTYLGSIRELGPALEGLGRDTEARVIKSLRESARFGHTAVVRTTRRTRDPHAIRASGSYENNWIKQDLVDGAILANAVFYAVFVERGRRPGRQPPIKPILEWIRQKKIGSKIQGPQRRFSGKGAKAARAAAREAMAASQLEADTALARAIARKIARKGTRGRWVLRRTMPLITRRAAREIRKGLRDISNNPPRR